MVYTELNSLMKDIILVKLGNLEINESIIINLKYLETLQLSEEMK